MKPTTSVHSPGSREAPIAPCSGEQVPATRQAGTAARIDRAMVDSLRDLRGKNDAFLFIQLYQGFAERARAVQSDVYAAAARGDWTTTLTILHKHRSSSGFLGLALYSQLCGELETLARAACNGDPPSAPAWSAACDAAALELQPGLDALDAHVSAGRGDPGCSVPDAALHRGHG